jgi:deazaflavin-dependent oxidoreductase (nitroreductase family)
MPAPRWLARFNLHFTNRILGPLAKLVPGMGVIVHAGRKTHRQYRTPVLVFRRGPHFIIALTYGRESQWVQNVLANGECELETTARTLHLSNPRLLHDRNVA